MDAIWQGLSGIFEVVLIAGLGFFLAKKGWFWENAAKDLTKLTMTVALPPLMIHSLYANFTHDALLEAAPDLVLPFVSIFASYLAGHVLASLLHISKGRRGIFICTCCIANAIFIGLPVNMALFGEASVPSCMLYYIANTAMFWFLGAYLIVKDAGDDPDATNGAHLTADVRILPGEAGQIVLKGGPGVGTVTKAGLGLEVFDAYTGRERSVTTLSGGEGFMAALSLALGLSDVVQAYAGGIQLDTLFIDEGFGSLDPESLDMAMKALIDLQQKGRMVGIISHVDDLKRQINSGIEVTLGAAGSHVRVGTAV